MKILMALKQSDWLMECVTFNQKKIIHYESFWGFAKMSHFYAQHKNIQNLNPNPLRPV
jgi:hypothetical protein